MAYYNPIEFVVLSLVFAAILGYMVYYNLRIRARQQANFGGKGHHMNSPGSIAASMTAEQRGDRT